MVNTYKKIYINFVICFFGKVQLYVRETNHDFLQQPEEEEAEEITKRTTGVAIAPPPSLTTETPSPPPPPPVPTTPSAGFSIGGYSSSSIAAKIMAKYGFKVR